mgnify:CR=1 FL=1
MIVCPLVRSWRVVRLLGWGVLMSAAVLADGGLIVRDTLAQVIEEQPARSVTRRNSGVVSLRFRESYGLPPDQDLKTNSPQYRVSLAETITIRDEVYDPEADKFTLIEDSVNQAKQKFVFSERPAMIDHRQAVSAVVRRYTSSQVEAAKAPLPKPLENLTLWCKRDTEGGASLQLIQLNVLRPLRYEEARLAATQPFLPGLSNLVTPLPVRVGESWRLSQTATLSLNPAQVEHNEDPRVTFEAIKAGDGPNRRIAVFLIEDRAAPGSPSQYALRARVEYDFEMSDPPPGLDEQLNWAYDPASRSARGDLVINARGSIVKIALSQVFAQPLPPEAVGSDPANDSRTDSDPAPERRRVLERVMILSRSYEDQARATLLPIGTPPRPTIQNSWIQLVEPSGRFQFLAPPDLQPILNPRTKGFDLIRLRPGGPFLLSLQFFPDQVVDLEAQRLGRFNAWKNERIPFEPGAIDRLDFEEWAIRPGQRFSARFAPADPKGGPAPAGPFKEGELPLLLYGYVVNDPPQGGLYAEAIVPDGEAAEPFRREIETILRTFESIDPAQSPSTP